jgi:hypothetical protein
LNRPHIFNASFIYLTPTLEDQNGFLKNVFGNWEVATIVILAHGNSITPHTGAIPGVGGGPAGTGYQNNQFLMRDPSQPCRASGGAPEQWLNPNAFTLAGYQIGTIGNGTRGQCYGPGLVQTDLALYKNWNIPFFKTKLTPEHATIQFRAEIFNLFNNVQFRSLTLDYNPTTVNYDTADPTTATRIISSTPGAGFGAATAVKSPREIQFGLKISF